MEENIELEEFVPIAEMTGFSELPLFFSITVIFVTSIIIFSFTRSIRLTHLIILPVIIFFIINGMMPFWLLPIYLLISFVIFYPIALELFSNSDNKTEINITKEESLIYSICYILKGIEYIEEENEMNKKNKNKSMNNNFPHIDISKDNELEYLNDLASIMPLMVVASMASIAIKGINKEMPNQLIQKKNKQGTKSIYLTTPTMPVTIETNNSSLEQEFIRIGFNRGTVTIRKLNSSYDKLNLLLSNDTDSSILNTKKIKSLTDDVYKQALVSLSKVLDISQQVNIEELETLVSENKELQSDFEKALSPKLKDMIQERLEKNMKNIRLMKQNHDKIDELLCQVGLCIDSIREIALEVPELIKHRPQEEFEKIQMELDVRMNYAQRVKEELVKNGV